jgi:F-type H+-transporting ATPase subunit gamma
MPSTGKDIQRRVKTVRNIKKITRAMELVSASKMRKSVSRVLATRPYADAAWQVVMNLIPRTQKNHHPLLDERPVRRVLVVVVGSNRGLCGSFNMNIINKAVKLIRKETWDTQNIPVDFMTFGKKPGQILSTLHRNIVADFPKNDITESITELMPLAHEVIQGFVSHAYDEVCVAYTHYVSSLRQEPRIRHLLPLVKPSRVLGGAEQTSPATTSLTDTLFEPKRDMVLEAFLPRLIEVQLYQAILEAEASEHSARMLAMRNATDAATDMLDALTLAFNQARQAAITAELAEIAAGSLAVV